MIGISEYHKVYGLKEIIFLKYFFMREIDIYMGHVSFLVWNLLSYITVWKGLISSQAVMRTIHCSAYASCLCLHDLLDIQVIQ